MLNKRPRILVIDDSYAVRQSLKFILRDFFQVYTAPGSLEGQFFLSVHAIDIVLLDIRLRDADGLKLLSDIKRRFPRIEVVMITAYASLETIRQALRRGAHDYLIKPFDKNELLSVVTRALAGRNYNERINTEIDKLRESTLYLEQLIRSAKDSVITSAEHIMTALLQDIHSRDGYTLTHTKRVADLSLRIADTMGMPPESIQWLRCAALVHDVGKITVDETILKKESALTDYEYEVMKRHPETGAEIIESMPFLKGALPALKHHHERYDGSGYPSGLKGTDIPFSARILAAADAIDSMMNSPVKRNTYGEDMVARELRRHASTQFDPEIVERILKEGLLFFA